MQAPCIAALLRGREQDIGRETFAGELAWRLNFSTSRRQTHSAMLLAGPI